MKLLSLHFRGIKSAFYRILSHPFEHLLNILTMALIISIMGAIIIIDQSNNHWKKNNINYPQIIVSLADNISTIEISKIKQSIVNYNSKIISGFQFISREEAIKKISEDNSLSQIEENPLPNILVINTKTYDNKMLEHLNHYIKNISQVTSIDIDIKYANKLSDLINFVDKTFAFLEFLFGLTLVLIIYNLIRLQLLLRQDEITVSRLIGASDSFIMRPLIYYALTQVLIAIIAAYISLNYFINFINGLFINLNSLFGREFFLKPLLFVNLLQETVVLVVFTIFAVFLAVKWIFKNRFIK